MLICAHLNKCKAEQKQIINCFSEFRIGLLINNTLPTLWLDLNFNRSGHFVI